jgi:predicted RNA-binding Zn ribbon-like protein
MVGDHPGADFLNTIDARGYANEIEHLVDYPDLLRWTSRAGLMKESELKPLRARAEAAPSLARRATADARALREAAHRIVMACCAGKTAPVEALALVKGAVAAATEARALVWTGRGLELQRRKSDELREPIHKIAFQLADLFAPENLARVHVCHGDDCDWAFLDRSPTQRRRWCHMSACGNRAKVRSLRDRRRS